MIGTAAIILAVVFLTLIASAQTLLKVYDPGAIGGRAYDLRGKFSGGNDKWRETFGPERKSREKAGSGTTDSAGELQIDGSTQFSDVTYIAPSRAGTTNVEWTDKPLEQILEHGTVTNAPFTTLDTVTGSVSGATGDVVGVGAGFLQLENVSGTFQLQDVITGSSSTAFASLTHPKTNPVIAAADDPLLDERRFFYLQFKDDSLVDLGAPTAVIFTYEAYGLRPRT